MTLALAFHNHQPVGNFPSVFEQAYVRAYEPMVSALERHPGIRVALHYSGPLLDWLQQAHPDLIARVRALVGRGQVEMMTGGYYEPILPTIPDRDKRGQILKMTQAARALFGYQATGLWLAERVWEPHLPRALAEAGVRYTIVDDTHFLHVGLTEAELDGHFITEEDGAALCILPSAKALRYRIPWAPVDELVNWLRAWAHDADRVPGGAPHDCSRASDTGLTPQDSPPHDGGRLLVMGDDGEKFGLWPGTHLLCWERGWIEAFFTALEASGDWLSMVTPGEWVRWHQPRGRVYLPTASYDEMTEWALPAPAAARLPALRHELEKEGRADLLPFLRGGFWRHFLVKYPEINTLHKTMLRVSRRVWRMRPGPRRDTALDHLWQGQCNCPYWHGVFGGIYLGHIRAANYAHLIEAERLADAARRPRRWVEAEFDDLDTDGRPEVLVRSGAQVLSIDPADGGSVAAWDAREARVNLANVMTRRPEGYHEALRRAVLEGRAVLARPDQVETIHTDRVRVKEWGLEQYLVYDWYRRSSFLDHFLQQGGGPEAFARGQVPELGDFVNQPYRVAVERSVGPGWRAASPEAGSPDAASSESASADAASSDAAVRPDDAARRGRSRAGTVVVRLLRDGHVWVDDVHMPVRVEKALTVPGGEAALHAAYRVTNMGDRVLAADFAVETCWGTTGPEAVVEVGPESCPVGYARRLSGAGAWSLRDEGWRLAVSATVGGPLPGALWVVPIEVVSASEAGYERTFQGASLLTLWPLRLEPGAEWEAQISFAIRPLLCKEDDGDR